MHRILQKRNSTFFNRSQNISAYVCMYVCMYVYMYVRLYVVCGFTSSWLAGRFSALTNCKNTAAMFSWISALNSLFWCMCESSSIEQSWSRSVRVVPFVNTLQKNRALWMYTYIHMCSYASECRAAQMSIYWRFYACMYVCMFVWITCDGTVLSACAIHTDSTKWTCPTWHEMM